MNFAKRELMKYGWKEGKGIGKESTGIVDPLCPKLKFDSRGLGFNYGKEYKNSKWWEHVYNNAAANIIVNSAKDGTKSVISTKFRKPIPTSSKNVKCRKKRNVKQEYNRFLKEGLQEDLRRNHSETEKFKKTSDKPSKLVPGQTSSGEVERNGKFSGKLARLLAHENNFLLNKKDIDTTCI